MYLPTMKIRHVGGNASRKGFQHVAMFIRSAARFFNKHGGGGIENSLLTNESSSRTVLITGATGFIGSEMLVTLKTNGYNVRVYSRRPMLPKFEVS